MNQNGVHGALNYTSTLMTNLLASFLTYLNNIFGLRQIGACFIIGNIFYKRGIRQAKNKSPSIHLRLIFTSFMAYPLWIVLFDDYIHFPMHVNLVNELTGIYILANCSANIETGR